MRYWTALLSVALAATAYAGQAEEPTSLERLTPANAVAFVQAPDLPALVAAFEKSAVADAIRGSKLMSYFRTVTSAAAQFAAVAATGTEAAELRACFGSGVGAVLLDFADRRDIARRIPVALLVDVADPQKLQAILSSQLDMFAALGAQIPIAKRQHKGVSVHDITPPKAALAISFAIHQGALIVGSPAGVNGILDHCAAKTPCVTAAEPYRAVRERLATKTGILAYVNVRSLIQKSGIDANPAQLAKARGIGIANAGGVGIAIDFEGRQVRERIFLHTLGAPTGALKALTLGKPSVPGLLGHVPRDYTLVGVLALNDVGLWDRIRGLVVDIRGEATASFLDTAAKNFHDAFGVQIKEGFFDTLTDQLFLAVDLRKVPEFFGTGLEPTPQQIPVLLGAKVKDAGLLEATLTRLATNEKLWEAGVTRQQRTHAGVPYYTFTLPRQLNLAPSYVVADGVLLAAARPEFIVQAIDARKQGKTFPVQRPAPAHLALHVDDSALLKILLRNVRDELPEKAKLLLPDLDALLAGLSGYTATMQREANGVLIESRSDLGTTGAIIIAGVLGDQGHAVVAKRVEGDFARIAKALEAHRAEHAAYPDTLDALVPKFLPELNGDRFEPKRAYGYRHVADAWVITSVGPNKRADIPVDAFNPPVWHAAHQSQDPEQIAKLKRRVYQFRKEQFKDETKHDDEGDLVRMGGPGLTAAPAPLKPQEAAP